MEERSSSRRIKGEMGIKRTRGVTKGQKWATETKGWMFGGREESGAGNRNEAARTTRGLGGPKGDFLNNDRIKGIRAGLEDQGAEGPTRKAVGRQDRF